VPSYDDSTRRERAQFPATRQEREGRGLPEAAPPSLASLASLAGSAAIARFAGARRGGSVLQRAPVADTNAAVAAAPGGPLDKLRDELDDDEVNEGKCLMWIGQLSEGERTLVRRDAALMKYMVDAFDRDEMSRAVEILGFPVAQQLTYILEAKDGGTLPPERADRLLNAATVPDFDVLVRTALPVVEWAYQGDPLTLAVCRANPANVTGWLGNPGFARWVLRTSGPTNLMLWIAANGAAAGITALKSGYVWSPLLEALRGEGPAGVVRDALRTLFLAATDPADRKALYEVRFDRRAEGTFDWMANGEAEWKQQESFAGGGGTTATVEAAIAAGGPKTAEDAAKAQPKGPVAQLAELLKKDDVPEEQCLKLMGGLTDAENYLVGKDRDLLYRMGRAFNGKEMTQALDLLRFLTLDDALWFIDSSNEEESIDKRTYQTLVNRSTAIETFAAAMSLRDCEILQKYSLVDPLSMPVAANDGLMQQVFLANAGFTRWVLDFRGSDGGGALALLRYLAAHTPTITYAGLRASGMESAFLKALPTGTALPAADQAAIKALSLAVADEPGKSALMKKRFNFDAIKEDAEDPGAGTFEPLVLDHMWDLFELLPPRDVADNKWLEDITRKTGGAVPNGVTGSNRVGVGYGPGAGAPESGAFTDPGDVMQGLSMFDANLVHEMGHASDREHGWTADGGPFDTEAALGQWEKFGSDADDLVDRWVADPGLNFAAGLKAEEVEMCVRAFKLVIGAKTASVEIGFRTLSLLEGHVYGAGDDPWQPLWARVQGHQLVQVVSKAQNVPGQSPWITPPPAVGGRIYHDTGYGYWASYLATARVGKLSQYSFRNKRDFFAELYATYYCSVPIGSRVQTWNAAIYDWFTKNVDAGRGTKATP
jgi:hypothetical protein